MPAPVPLVGDTLSQVAVGAPTVHCSVPPPVLLTWTVLAETLLPTLVCRLKDVGLTDSTGVLSTASCTLTVTDCVPLWTANEVV